jgi:TPR repeat protein
VGRGVPQDYTVARSWYQKAANQGDMLAQSNLGFIYGWRIGVPPDFAIAVSWYQKAADQGNTEAQPGWLTEVIADYIRYYRYQPETHSADIKSPRRAAAAGHDGVTA